MTMSARPFVLCAGVIATGLTTSARQDASPLGPLVLHAGFQAEVLAEKVENARSMALGPQGPMFVGSQYVGKVHAVVDSDKDQKADRVVVIASGLDQPNGVASSTPTIVRAHRRSAAMVRRTLRRIPSTPTVRVYS